MVAGPRAVAAPDHPSETHVDGQAAPRFEAETLAGRVVVILEFIVQVYTRTGFQAETEPRAGKPGVADTQGRAQGRLGLFVLLLDIAIEDQGHAQEPGPESVLLLHAAKVPGQVDRGGSPILAASGGQADGIIAGRDADPGGDGFGPAGLEGHIGPGLGLQGRGGQQEEGEGDESSKHGIWFFVVNRLVRSGWPLRREGPAVVGQVILTLSHGKRCKVKYSPLE